MIKCSWKTGLFFLAGAFLLTFSGSARAADILEYSGSNKAVQAKVDEFNEMTEAADPAAVKALEDKRTQFGKEKLAAYKEYKEKQLKFNKYWVLAQAEVSAAKGKIIADDYYNSLKMRLSVLGDVFSGDFEKAWAGIKGTVVNDIKVIKKVIEASANLAWTAFKIEAQMLLETATGVRSMVDSYRSQVNKNYANTAVADELYAILDEMKKAADKYVAADNNYNAIANNMHGKGDLYVYTDPKTGQKIFFAYNKDSKTAETIYGNTRGCIPLPMKLAEGRSCIFCPLFKTVFNAAQDMTTKSYGALAGAISQVMLVGFALWIAFSLLGKVSSFTKMDAPKYITELLTQIFKVLIAFLLLRDASALYFYLVGPLLRAGMEFGMTLLFTSGSEFLGSCNDTSALKNLSGGMLPEYLYVQLECFIQAVQAELAVPQSIGSSLMCVAQNAGSIDLGIASLVTDYRLPDFSMLFQGLIIWVFAWLISLAFAFYLIDATVRLGIVGALMPFLIACWPFKLTSKYTTQGFTMFMNTFFTYVFMGLVVSVNIQLMGQSLTGAKGGFEAIANALNANEPKVLKELLDIGFAGFLILIASCIFGFKLTAQATELAGTMAGGGGGGPIAPQIGGMAANVAKAGALGTAKKGWQGTKFLGNVTGVTPKLRQGRDKALGWVGKKLGFGGSSAGGAPASRPAPKSAPTPTSTPTSTPATTPTTPLQQQQAEKVQNAAPRPEPTPTPNQAPTPTQTHSEQTPKPNQNTNQTTTPVAGEQKPKPLSPEELHSKLLKEFETSDAGNTINQAISNQSSRRAEHRDKLDRLREDRRRAREDERWHENASRDEKLPENIRANMAEGAKNARQRARDFENQIQAEQAEIQKCDDTINSLNELKGNTAEQYAKSKADPKNNPEINTADIVNQVNNMTA